MSLGEYANTVLIMFKQRKFPTVVNLLQPQPSQLNWDFRFWLIKEIFAYLLDTVACFKGTMAGWDADWLHGTGDAAPA